jgi:hypothetical protein
MEVVGHLKEGIARAASPEGFDTRSMVTSMVVLPTALANRLQCFVLTFWTDTCSEQVFHSPVRTVAQHLAHPFPVEVSISSRVGVLERTFWPWWCTVFVHGLVVVRVITHRLELVFCVHWASAERFAILGELHGTELS